MQQLISWSKNLAVLHFKQILLKLLGESRSFIFGSFSTRGAWTLCYREGLDYYSIVVLLMVIRGNPLNQGQEVDAQIPCSAGVFFEHAICSRKRHVENSRRGEEMGRVKGSGEGAGREKRKRLPANTVKMRNTP